MPVPVSRWAGRNIKFRAAKWVFAPQSSEITALSENEIADSLYDHLRSQRHSRRRFDFGEQPIPVRHAALRLLEKRPV